MKSPFAWFALVGLLCGAALAAASPALPAYVALPSALHLQNADALSVEGYGQAAFEENADKDPSVRSGKHWSASFTISGATDETPQKAIWAQIKPSLIKAGWKAIGEFDANPFRATLRLQKDGKDAWLDVQVFGSEDIRLELIEVGQPQLSLVLTPPAATPEKFAVEKGDFPYLKPLPGAKPMGGQREGTPMTVTFPGSEEAQVVGTGSTAKDYADPPGLSNAYFLAQYRNALTKAGWTIIDSSGGIGQSDAVIIAHYARNGRDIWAYLHHGGGEMLFRVADRGADNLAQQLAKTCHVALYGVLFDFNKATLKAESTSVLTRVADVLIKDATLKVEVQGHTDNVGSDDYNQKLSEARAKSVMAWLSGHGVAANRLSAKGYGKRMPVADNDSDEGRAKNRRVEIAKPGCSAH